MKKRLAVFTVCMAVSLLWSRLDGTTVVIVRTPQHIVIAEDSLVSHLMNGQPIPPTVECKIKALHGVYFVDSTTDVNAQQVLYLAGKALKATHTVTGAAQKLTTMSDELAQAILREPEGAAEKYLGKTGAEAAFSGMENGVPTVVLIRFKQIRDSQGKLTFKPHVFSCPGDCPKDRKVVVPLGTRDAIVNLQKTDPSFLDRYPDQDIARKLVELEKEAFPQFVGGTIDEVTLDATGAHWEPNKDGVCTPDEQPSKRPVKKH